MLSAIGTHGPTVSSTTLMLLNTILFTIGAWLLIKPQDSKQTWLWPLLLLAGLASASRIAMGFIPNVMPVTILAVMVGSKFGAQRGFAFAILVTLASNSVLGHGWWSLFQILGWGSVAVLASMVKVHDEEGDTFDVSTCICIIVERPSVQHHRFPFHYRRWNVSN